MKYIKINNFYNQFGQPDYKGLDLKQILAGSQLYPTGVTYCVVATNEELATLPTDIEELTADQYNTEKANMPKPADPQNDIDTLKAQNAQIILSLVNGGLM
ncbi:hypothetical protein [Clostridium sp.]|uniref:hypothetical protein n=1 Tax=Clostridium sp. TaxID=1506 RepID=UPI0035A1B569